MVVSWWNDNDSILSKFDRILEDLALLPRIKKKRFKYFLFKLTTSNDFSSNTFCLFHATRLEKNQMFSILHASMGYIWIMLRCHALLPKL